MTKVMSAEPNVLRGQVRIVASGVPQGSVILSRRSGRGAPETIRGGTFDVSTGGFIKVDAEPVFGSDLVYRVVDTITNRALQTNRVLNPKMATNILNWTTGAGRTAARETAAPLPPRDAVTSLRIGPLVGGDAIGGLDQRLLAKCSPSGLTAGRWFVSGQLRYDSPDIWLWDDVKNAGTWQTIKNKGTWQTVKSSTSPAAGTAFASLWVTALSPTSATTTRTNLARNARQTVDSTGYGSTAGTSGVVTGARVATGGPTAARAAFWRTTWTTATTAVSGGGYAGVQGNAVSPYAVPVTAGQPYTASLDVRTSKIQRVSAVATFYDASGAALGTVLVGTPAVTVANTWTRLSVAGTAPANAVRMIVSALAQVGTSGTNWAIGDTLDVTGPLIEQTANAVAGTFFDAESVDTVASPTSVTYNWTGAAYQSPSVEASTSGVLMLPIQILGVETADNGNWATFQGWIDIPVGSPAGCQLAFYQGTVIREYAVTWWLTTVMVTPEAEMTAGAVTPYFDGDSTIPANPAWNVSPGLDWNTLTGDASMTWSGTPNGSWSQFTAPSQIFAEVSTYIGAPVPGQLPQIKLPIYLSDPVAPQLAQWFELVEIGDLTFAARAALFDVLGRGAQIAVSQLRAWPAGELRVMTYTQEQAEVAERLFSFGRILYWRNPDPRYPENGWYVHIGDTASGRVSPQLAYTPERLWRVPFVKVERPEGLIAASSSVTWAMVKAGYTWDELRRERQDWLDAALTAP